MQAGEKSAPVIPARAWHGRAPAAARSFARAGVDTSAFAVKPEKRLRDPGTAGSDPDRTRGCAPLLIAMNVD